MGRPFCLEGNQVNRQDVTKGLSLCHIGRNKKRVQTEACTRTCRCPKVYLRIKPPRSSMASQKASAKRGSLAAMRALVAIQPEGVPVS